jgi:hypothetical protein
MSMHLQQEIEHLKNKLLTLVATAKGAVEKAVKSVDERDAASRRPWSMATSRSTAPKSTLRRTV